jgi:hypothetical protein
MNEELPMTDIQETADTDLTAHDRRALLRKIAIGGAGAAAGAVLLSNGRVSAGNQGDPGVAGAVELGVTNTAIDPTIIDVTPAGTPAATGPSAFSAGGYAPDNTIPFPAGVGGYGDATILHGVHGSTTAPAGYGVVAANLSGAAADADAAVPTAQAIASPNGAHMLLLAGSVVGPTPGKHVAGELYVDADGTLWFTVPAPTTDDADAVRFVKLAGSPASGSFHAIDPQRAYDSRQEAYTVKGQLAPNESRVISVADGHDTNGGAVTTADVVPVGATAVQINVTAANMTAPNFLSVTAGDKTSTNTSLLNWSPGDIQIANSITVPLDADRQIRVYCGNQTGSTDVIIDVFGYYL